MKALTVLQPYAHLILLPDDDNRAKRVENRTWETLYRGPLLIHAGKSMRLLRPDSTGTVDEEYGIPFDDMEFGAIVGVADLVGCVHLAVGPNGLFDDWVYRRWPWLRGHRHVEGPFCWVLTECCRFARPIPYRGAQGLFDIPDNVVAEQLSLLNSERKSS